MLKPPNAIEKNREMIGEILIFQTFNTQHMDVFDEKVIQTRVNCL